MLSGLANVAASHSEPVHLHTLATASLPWLDRLNLWRASTGVPQLTENATWSAGDYDHSQYMVMNDLVTHYEIAGYPYYTTAGNTAASDSNIYVSSSTSTADSQAIDWWMGAPFHAMGMMDPRLTSTGFGAYRYVKSGWQMGAALDVIRGNSFSGGTFPVEFPGNGSTEPLTSYSGNEFPDPLQACSGYAAPTGLPVFIELGGNVKTSVSAASITANGLSLPACAIDSNNAAVGSYLYARGGVILIPRNPLQNGVTYTVALTVNGSAYRWSFTVGQFLTCTVNASPAPPSPSAPGASVIITASSTGCATPLYEFWMLAPGSTTWQLVQPYATSATLTWNTAGLSGGTYLFSVWVRATASSGTFGDALGRWDGYTSLRYALTFTPCTSLTAAAAPSPAAVGTAVLVSGAASGCPNPLYEFWSLAPGSAQWRLAQAYSSASTFTWNTAGALAGTYRFSVWTRDASSPGVAANVLGTWDAYVSTSDLLVSACTAVTASSSPPTTASPGAPVVITGSAAGCSNPLYEFWMLSPGSQTWQLVQAYSTTPTFSWDTTGKAAGTYHLSVWARDASSTGLAGDSLGRWDAYVALQYTLS